MATTSFGSSTTQRIARSRRGSRQIRHCSSADTLPQTTQNRTFSLTSLSACTRRRTSSGSDCRMWKAIRWALFGPTPGSRPSSSIRSWTTPSYTVFLFGVGWSEAGEAETAAATETAGERAHGARSELVGRALGITDGGDDEILQRLEVVRVHRRGGDRHRDEIT